MLPSFIVIGAPRSGTTSLYEYLNAHPQVFMSSVKEPDFFSRSSLDEAQRGDQSTSTVSQIAGAAHHPPPELRSDLEEYTALFARSGGYGARGEASAVYLGHPRAAEHIRRYVPDAKLIAILRDPAERLHSHYVHAKRIYAEAGITAEQRNLDDDLATVVDRAYREGRSGPAVTDPEVWLQSGFYFEHLTRFRALFPEEQLRVFLFEDLLSDPQGLMADIFAFLGVDEHFSVPTTAAFNASVVPRNRLVFQAFTKRNPVMRFARSIAPTALRAGAMRTRNRLLAHDKPTLAPEMRSKLVSIYSEDIERLQVLLGRDLSAWLNDRSG